MRQLSARLATAALAVTMFAQVASAQVFAGTTVGGALWNRPVGGMPPAPPLSSVGTNVAFDAFSFRVTQSGSYSFRSVATSPLGWDNYLFLYQNSFDPNSQFSNIIVGNDDFPNIGISGFDDIALLAGTDYIAVTSGFDNDDAGAYDLSIRGPGTAFVPGNEVPEPATFALLALGLFGLGAARSRRVS